MKPKTKNIAKEFHNLRKNLLDLTLRNQLLNFKPRSKTLTITNQSPTNVYQTLVIKDHVMTFVPNKKEEEEQSRFRRIWDHPSLDLQIFKDGDKTLKADLSPSELQKRLFYINQQANSMIQEQGYNILYLAVGFLKWIDKNKPKQNNLAPLILIPVQMERKNVGKSFNLRWTGEEIQTNISLKAKLLEEGIELPEFVQVKSIEGITDYLNNVKNAVKSQKNWEVINNIALGFFSFTKFLMYNDLDPESFKNSDIRSRYSLIEAIFDPEENIYEDTIVEEDIDKIEYINRYNVLDADSSQMAAIENVKAGHNLVVEGPPGTGKSQTIVNLISELLAEDKTVLFVSEKMAALDVVKSRMEKVGLGKFVLELHSHKARRKKILKDLEKSTNVHEQSNVELEQTVRKLEVLRRQLDDYADIIHQPVYNINLSPFQLYGMKESSEDHFIRKGRLLPLVRCDNSQDITMKDLDEIILSLENLAELGVTITKENPWSLTKPKSLLPQDLREIEFLIDDTMLNLTKFLEEADTVNQIYGIKTPSTLKEYKRSIEALKLLDTSNTEIIDPNIIGNIEWVNSPSKAHELIECIKDYQDFGVIRDKFNDNILTTNIEALIEDIEKAGAKKFRLFGGSNYKNQLKNIYIGEPPSDNQAINDLLRLQAFFNARHTISKYEKAGFRYFGRLWDVNSSYEDLLRVEEWMRTFTPLLVNGTFSEQTLNLLKEDIYGIDTEDGAQEYLKAGMAFTKSLSNLEHKLNPRNRQIFKKDKFDVSFQQWQKQLQEWKGQIPSLHLWSQYLNVKNECLNNKSSIFVETIEKRKIRKDDVKPLVYGNFADSLLNIVFNNNETLATFIGELHENRIKEFKDLDNQMILLNRKRLYNKLNNKIPQIFGAANNPENQVLAGEFTRKSGHLPVRTLLEKAGGTIKKIKPCFMMSPLSIAQYLDPTNETLQFDVVIFDEASQVKPEDALGAFMRADTAVVMGDTQQLPPTSFFDQMTDGESDEELATALDMESILHLCKLSFPVKMLKWHYRSRHESLISTSNKEFYDNELLVYPSPSHNDPELGLKFEYHQDTYYERGAGSNNIEEAKLVVQEIFKHFEKYGDKKSLGVGTFSVSQRNAIMEELEIQRKYHPELEPLFNEDRSEHFFVKNLETIQGDERDVIIISIGYGFDKEGKLSLNFGPLNQEGGERRLNVLITRAREKCIVFSNFKASDMHLTHNPPFGVRALKNFLEYAETINYGAKVVSQEEKEPFEDAVYNFLIENGYSVDKKVGCAGFRMDLAVIDANNPGRYILGIECDGKIYSSSKVATDRDRLRDQVLKGLGWNIYHLWSTDWYRNRDFARKRLLSYIEEVQRQTVRNEISIELEDAKNMEIIPVTTYIPSEHGDGAEEIEEVDEVETIEVEEIPELVIEEVAEEEEEELVDEEPPMFTYESPAYVPGEEKEETEEEVEEELEKEIEPEVETEIETETTDFKFHRSLEESSINQELKTIIDENIIVPEVTEETEEEEAPQEEYQEYTEEVETPQEEYQEYREEVEPIQEEYQKYSEEVDNIGEDTSLFEDSDDIIYVEHGADTYEHEVLTPDAEINYDNLNPLNDNYDTSETEEDYSDSDVIIPEHNVLTPEDEGYIYGDNSENNDSYVDEDLEDYEDYEYQEGEYYQAATNMDNQLRKNKVTRKKQKNQRNNERFSLRSLTSSLQDVKDELKYIDDSLKEIENPTELDDVYVVGRSSEDNIPQVSPEEETINVEADSIDETIDSFDVDDNIVEDTIINQIEVPEDNGSFEEVVDEPTIEDDKLDNIITGIAEDIEGESKPTNVLKYYDDTGSDDNVDMEELVPKYEEARNIKVSNTKDLYALSSEELGDCIVDIVKQESPMHKSDLILRLREACKLKRAGAKFKNAVGDALELSLKNGKIRESDDFLFYDGDRPVIVRRRVKPSINLICDEEITQNVLLVLTLEKSLELKKLIKSVANNFGFKSTSKKTSARITSVVDNLILNQIVINNNGYLELLS